MCDIAVMFTHPQTAAILFIQVPQTKVGGEGLPGPFRGSRGREGLVGSGVTPQRASVQEGPKPNWKRWGCWSPEVQPTQVGQAGPGEGRNEEASWLSGVATGQSQWA